MSADPAEAQPDLPDPGPGMAGAAEDLDRLAREHCLEPADRPHIELKRGHSYRVLDNARRLMAGIDFPQRLAQTCRLAALFHDAGRFPQYARYKTFHDGRSENHALLGVRTLRSHGLPSGLTAEHRALALGAVALHNRRLLPRGIGPDLRLVTQVVRDADKLDIMRVMVEHLGPRSAGQDPVVTLNVADHPTRYTESVYRDVLAGRMGDYREMRWVNDFKLLILGWIRQLNFATSRELVRRRGLAHSLLAMLPDLPEMDRLGRALGEVLGPKRENGPPHKRQAAS